MGIDDESSHPALCSEVADGVTRTIVCLFREPDAGNPPVRFDEREEETELCQTGLRRRGESSASASHREATVTAPLLDSTQNAWRPEAACYSTRDGSSHCPDAQAVLRTGEHRTLCSHDLIPHCVSNQVGITLRAKYFHDSVLVKCDGSGRHL